MASSRFVPGGVRCKQFLVSAALLLLAGCGSGEKTAPTQIVRGTGYRFDAPAGWEVARTGRQVQAVEGGKSLALVAVSRFPLLRRYRPVRFDKVVRELDLAAGGIAAQQHGSVSAAATTRIAGERARRYDVRYEARGKQLVERLAFVLRGRTEYLLLCRFERGADTSACDGLLDSFRLV